MKILRHIFLAVLSCTALFAQSIPPGNPFVIVNAPGKSGTVTGVTNTDTNLVITSGTTAPVINFAHTIVGVNSITAQAATDLTLSAGSGTQNIQLNPTGGQVFVNVTNNNASMVLNRTGTNAGSVTISTASFGGLTIGAAGGTSGAITSIAPSASYTNSSGIQTVFQIVPTYNQTGTAGGTDFLINRTQIAVGSGNQRFIDAQIGGTSKFILANDGGIINQSITFGTNATPSTGNPSISAPGYQFYNDGATGFIWNGTGAFKWQNNGGTAIFTLSNTGYGVFGSNGNVGTAQTPGLTVTNTTAAANGAQQDSPMLVQTGFGWATNSGGTSQQCDMAWQVAPAQSSASPTFVLNLLSRVNGGTWTQRLYFDQVGGAAFNGGLSAGTLTSNGSISATTTITANDQFISNINGSAANPAFNRGSLGTGSGLFFSAAGGDVGIAAGGTQIALFKTNLNTRFAGAATYNNYTVSTLPSASTTGAGSLAFVTDATLTAITGLGLAVTGGGSNKVFVYSDGTNWLIL